MKFFKQFGQAFLGICLAFLFTEGLLRISAEARPSPTTNDPTTGLLTYVPNSTFTAQSRCYKNKVHINNWGFYAPEYQLPKEKGVFRVIVVGNSFVEATQVALDNNFTQLLEKKLNETSQPNQTYEVIPIAFSGNGDYLSLLYYKKYAEKLQPDLVIVLATDFLLTKNSPNTTYPPRFNPDGSLILELPETVRNQSIISLKNAIRHSQLATNFYLRGLQIKNNLLVQPVSETSSSPATKNEYIDLLATEDIIISTFKKITDEKQVPLVLVSWVGDTENMSGHLEFGQGLAQISQKNKVAYLDLQPIILKRTAQENKQPYWPCDGHWNETGHLWTAEAIFDFLKSNPKKYAL